MAAEITRDALLARFAWTGGHANVWRWFDDAETIRAIAAALVDPFRRSVTKVAGIESRGFILGTACALELDVGFVPIRKGDGLFPGPKAVAETSADYRGGHQTLRLQRAALAAGDRVLLVDDWIETGSQAAGARSLIEECGAVFLGVAAIVDQLPPDRHEHLVRIHALVPAARLGDGS
ncbi:MAG TPA: phosphoribosyltransferase family protein [Gaiellales bacterium]